MVLHSAAGTGISSMVASRPRAISSIFPSAVTEGCWIQGLNNTQQVKEIYNRVVNNVTLSMSHAGIYYAIHHARNGISQPLDGTGLGEYTLQASVVSPSTSVICVNLNKLELAPIVYTAWPNARLLSSATWQKIPASDYQLEITQFSDLKDNRIKLRSMISLNGVLSMDGTLLSFQWYANIIFIPFRLSEPVTLLLKLTLISSIH